MYKAEMGKQRKKNGGWSILCHRRYKTAGDLVSNNGTIHLSNSVWNVSCILYVEQIIISTTISPALHLGLRATLLLFREAGKVSASRVGILHFFSGEYLCFRTLSEVVRQGVFEHKN